MESISSDARLSKILDDMMPTKLFWQQGMKPYGMSKLGRWVFWSEEASANLVFQKHIVNALSSCPIFPWNVGLIQFWAAEMIGGQTQLTTTLQPFSLSLFGLCDEKLIQYRKICVGSNLVVADDVNIMDAGILGRVFRNQLPEASPDLSYYSVTEYPQRELALSCGFNSMLALPVLETSERCCVGVLELLCTSDPFYFFNSFFFNKINEELKNESLETIDMDQIRTTILHVRNNSCIEKEINMVLKKVCKKHKLTSAHVWVRCAHIRSVDHAVYPMSYNDYCVNCKGELLVNVSNFSCDGYDSTHCDFSSIIPLKLGQGLVGKAVLYRKPYFCQDVSQLSITQYPLVHHARKARLASCFAVYLRSISTGNREVVVEFFLPRNMTCMGAHHIIFSSILTTMNQHLRTFEVVSQDRNQLFIEVDKFSFHKDFATVNTQLEYEALQNDGKVMQSGEQLEIDLSPDNIPPMKQSKSQNLEKKYPYSHEDLEQHFGKKLTDAAEILGVSRSTLKRICREHNIYRWPSYKRSKVFSSLSTPKQMNVVSGGNIETISQASGKDPLCSEPSTNVALTSATSRITVKANFGEKLFVFKLLYSSTMEDLVEKVITRTELAKGTFDITYLDIEDDRISLACDEDLHDCMEGKTTIRMQIEPFANKSPLNPLRSKTRFLTSSNFINQFPSHMHGYIDYIIDVIGDGHCGFRAIAEALERPTHAWENVRAMLWQELNNHQELYSKVFIEHGRVEKVLESLHFYGIPAPKEYWFDYPEMGYLVASVYNVALVCLNKQISFTYLPLRTRRPENPKLISIGYVNNDHYVQLMLQENAPLPPVPTAWNLQRDSCASEWLDYYRGQLEMYRFMSAGN